MIEFDYRMYGGTSQPGDGISFFLIDGSKSPTALGGDGAGLGYSNRSGGSGWCGEVPGGTYNSGFAQGIEGGYIGLGLDVVGNYSQTSADSPYGNFNMFRDKDKSGGTNSAQPSS